MKKSIGSVFLAFVFLTVLLSGCAPAATPIPPTLTPIPSPIPSTFTPAPTATRTSVPPTATATLVPTPTASGEFGFFNVSLKQLSADQVAVSFIYQLKQGVDPTGLMIIAAPPTEGAKVSCNTFDFSLFQKPFTVPTSASGFVDFDNGPAIQMTSSAKCSYTAIRLILFSQTAGPDKALYDQTFDISFTLEKN